MGNVAEQIVFVLSHPMQSGNIGSAARALKNMGFANLRIVAPAASAQERAATAMAVHADDVLAAATVYDDLAAALADCAVTVGTTCRPGPYRSAATSVREAAPGLVALAATNRVAIVFGSEDHGLTNDELKLCYRLVTVPAAPDYPSLNLAQAVMVVAYELYLAANSGEIGGTPELAAAGDVETMFIRMAEALVAIGFLPEDNPDHIMFTLRGVFGRSGLTPRELDILNGIARQIRWTADGGAITLAEKRAAGKKLK
ncbi:MAG TPA: RNA methyltransferase [Candidatus Binataceae bacterium]|nr:RNA methyltransferase [Candidatus Binataceae bacterium]